MNKEDSRKRLKSIVSEITGVDSDKIMPDSDFKDDLGADSLDVVELLVDVEDVFKVRFDWEKINEHNLNTINDVEKAIELKREGNVL